MEWIAITFERGGNPTQLVELLNDGWIINRADACDHTIVYLLFKRVPGELGGATLASTNSATGPTPTGGFSNAPGYAGNAGIPHFGSKKE